MKKIVLVSLAVLIVLSMIGVLWACRLNVNIGPGQDTEKEEQQEEQEEQKDPVEEIMDAVVPPEDFELAGEYQDETSQRAVMTITPDGEDHYQVEFSWGDSATKTTVWSFEGDFDRAGGILSDKNGIKSVLTVSEEEGMEEKVVYESGRGALMYFNEGLHWQDDKEDAGKDCVFVKTGDEDVVIEEE